jgi:hypothetical protein
LKELRKSITKFTIFDPEYFSLLEMFFINTFSYDGVLYKKAIAKTYATSTEPFSVVIIE